MTATANKTKQIRPKVKLNVERVNQLLTQDLTQAEIAATQNVHPSTITRYMQSLPPEEVHRYKSNRIDKLVEDQLYAKALNRRAIKYYIDLEDSEFEAIAEDKKIGLINASNVSAAVSYDKERLESGQATEIHDVNIRALIASITPDKAANGD